MGRESYEPFLFMFMLINNEATEIKKKYICVGMDLYRVHRTKSF